MIIHFLGKGPVNQISGGYLYDRYVLDYLVAAGYSVNYHEDSTRLNDITGDDCIIADSLVLNELPEILLSMRCPTVLLLHVVPDESTPDFGHMAVDPRVFESLYAQSLIVVTGTDSLRRVRRSLPDLQLNAVCIEPGVPANWLEKKEYSDTARTLLCIANYADYKGHRALFRFLQALQDLDWTLTVFGNTNIQPGYYDELVAKLSQYEWADRVICRAEIAHDEVNNQMLNSDLLVHLSEDESYSMVVAEAIASGLPVFACRTGNHEAFARSGLVHYVDKPDTSLVDAELRALMDDPSVYARLRRSATWQKRDWNDVGREFALLLEAQSWS